MLKKLFIKLNKSFNKSRETKVGIDLYDKTDSIVVKSTVSLEFALKGFSNE